ncbi:MAG: TetR/AcrR family transcriptional regulator [Methylococcaceae bacterium]|nr:TetR/AcrR family transcriptional regulator [Methylococcaceae bacterium]
MRRSKQQTARTRCEIIEAASALFRERGLDGVSVAELMDKVGLTHGGFYKHFDSKEALLAEAATAAFEDTMREWRNAMETNQEQNPVRTLIDLYLSESHRKDLEHGCPVVSLGSEMTRSGGAVRSRFAKGIRDMIEVFEDQLGEESPSKRKELAITIVACLVGAMVIARCSDHEKTAQSYLDAARGQLVRFWELLRD